MVGQMDPDMAVGVAGQMDPGMAVHEVAQVAGAVTDVATGVVAGVA